MRTLAMRGPLLVIAVLLVAALLAWVGNNWDPEQFARNLQGLLPGDPPAAQVSSPGGEAPAASDHRAALARAIEGDIAAPAGSVPLQALDTPAAAAPAPGLPPPTSPAGAQAQPPQPATERPRALRGLLAEAVRPRSTTATGVRNREPAREPARVPLQADREAPAVPVVGRDISEAPAAPRPAPERRPPSPPDTIPPDVLQAGRLLDAFSSHYADGDLGALASLFSPAANAGTGGVPALRREYAALFRASRRRSLLVTGVQWRARGATLVGQGRFFARLTRRDGSEGVATGSIEVVVEHGPRGPRIAELHHREGG